MDNNRIEKVIEFDKIKELWMEFAMTDIAKEKIRNMVPYLSESELEAALRETSESRRMMEICGNPPVVSLNGITQWKGRLYRICEMEFSIFSDLYG